MEPGEFLKIFCGIIVLGFLSFSFIIIMIKIKHTHLQKMEEIKTQKETFFSIDETEKEKFLKLEKRIEKIEKRLFNQTNF